MLNRKSIFIASATLLMGAMVSFITINGNNETVDNDTAKNKVEATSTQDLMAANHISKCGEGEKSEEKCGEGEKSEEKCGEGKGEESKCGEGKGEESKCGEGKGEESKCGEGKHNHKKEKKCGEGKSSESKCGG